MANESEQLIRRITELVLCRLQGRGDAAPDRNAQRQPARDAAGPAAIRPPIGVCTGDYSKFPELRGRSLGAQWHGHPARDPASLTQPKDRESARAAPLGSQIKGVTAGAAAGRTILPQPPKPARNGRPAPPPPPTRPAPTAGAPVLTGFVTARQLEAANGAPIRLAPDARLTPLAADYIKDKKLTVERIGSGAASSAAPPAPRSIRWLWWIDGHCKAAEAIAGQLRDRLIQAPQTRLPPSLAPAVRDMARAVRDGRAAGGILFVHSAAQAACFANRCPSLRAVVGTCGEAVEQGIDLLGANVLIVEYPHQGPAAMRVMVERFIEAHRKPLTEVDRRLGELTRCV